MPHVRAPMWLRTLLAVVALGAILSCGALIDGEAGVGYRLIEDPALPPQSFSRIEIEALLLAVAQLFAQPRQLRLVEAVITAEQCAVALLGAELDQAQALGLGPAPQERHHRVAMAMRDR